MAGNDRNDRIPTTYAGAGLRWSLLLTDYPGADYDWEMAPGTSVGIPENWGGSDEVCVVTINFPPDSGLKPVAAWKAASEVLVVDRWHKTERGVRETVMLDRDPALLNTLITQTLGRACKKAGYVDDMNELAALVRWRLRKAELAAAGGGSALPALPAGQDEVAELEAELTRAGRADPEDAGHDDTAPALSAPEHEPLDVDSEEVDLAGAPTEETLSAMRVAIGALPVKEQKAVSDWAKKTPNVGWPRPASESAAQEIRDYALSVSEGLRTQGAA